MGWREDVDAVTAGTPHGPLLNGISGGVFPCACGERFGSGWVVYRHTGAKTDAATSARPPGSGPAR